MTLQVLKSQINETFESDVEAHRQALLAHRFTTGQPAPVAPFLIEQAVARVAADPGFPDDFVADYRIVDDTPPPPPEPTEAELKARALMEIRQWEQDEIAKIIPSHRRRLVDMEYSRIAMIPDGERSTEQDEFASDYRAKMKEIDEIGYQAAVKEAAL